MKTQYCFRPLTGIMIFNLERWFLQWLLTFHKSFRPLTGIMIFNSESEDNYD